MRTMIDVASTLAASETPHESWIQIMKTGTFDHPKEGQIHITPETLRRMKENFDAKVRGTDLAVDVSHNPDAGAVAWFKELKVDGDKLMARVAWTDEGAELVKSGKYRYFSPEFAFGWTHPEQGKKFRDVLFGGALTNRPFLKDMQPLAFSEAGMATMWYDPDHDGDNDTTANPTANPDWMQDVRQGITPWAVCTPEQKQQLIAHGVTKAVAEKAHAAFMAAHPHLTMAEDGVTDSHDTPPKGKPTNRDLYADPAHYKYPIDAQHIRAAVSYFNHPGMREKGGYGVEAWAAIGRRIAAAANRLIAPGHEFRDGRIETATNHAMADPTSYDPDAAPTDDGGVATPHPVRDTDAGQYTDPQGGIRLGDNTVVTMEEWRAQQDRLRFLETENKRVKLSETVRGWLFDETTKTGRLVPAQRDAVIDFMMSLDEAQTAQFTEIVQGLPPVIAFGEIGTSVTLGAHASGGETREDRVVKLAEAKVKDGMAWRDAFLAANEEVPQ